MVVLYAAEILLALSYLHNTLQVAYRDLKPENILLDADGHIRLVDFGNAKFLQKMNKTMCGTPNYMAPEILMNKGYSESVDWWGLGCVIYEMFEG